MTAPALNKNSDVRLAVIVGTLITILWTALTWRYGLDLSDEGYYWYGSQRVLRGEVPMRDFLSYDIGRYYWSALLMRLMGDDGIVGARMSAAVFRAGAIVVGVFLALYAADGRLRTTVKCLFAALVAVLLNVWVHPFYKVFDYGTSILLIAMLAWMIRRQTVRAWFGAGIILGLAAVIGRNHGMYGAFAALLLLVFLLIKHPQRTALFKPGLAYIAGVIVGFSPNFFMALFVDGYAAAFIVTLRDLVQSGSANIGLPVPWPWTFDRGILGWIYWSMGVSMGMAFLALVAVPVIAGAFLLRRPLAQFRPLEQVALAAAMGSLGYAHYAYSRSDVTHLSHSIVGVLLLVLCAGLWLRRPLVAGAGLLILSIMVMAQDVSFLAGPILHKRLETTVVNGITLHVFPYEKFRVEGAEQIFDAYPQGRTNFLAIPNAPSLHAMAKTKMQIWEIYALSKRPAVLEQAEIARLDTASPALILLSDHALDKHSELRFSLMHPLTFQWINAHYQRVPALPNTLDPSWETYIRKH